MNKNFFASNYKIDPKINQKHYDIAIIGGGTGGLSLALESKKLGLNPIIFDYVDPSPHNTKWGLGGCCVNVGCIPKKLFHEASLIQEKIHLSQDYGFTTQSSFSWEQLKNNVTTYIKSINFGYRSQLSESKIPYVNAMATLEDAHTVRFSNKETIEAYLQQKEVSELGSITADYIVIAVGGRPNYLDIENKHLAITSDDLFRSSAPNKTLVVGGGYIAIECAGFLSGMAMDTTLMTRGKFLRSFDRDMADYIIEDLKHLNQVNIKDYHLPVKLEKMDNGQINVTYQDLKTQALSQELFDTVLMAVGRTPAIRWLNLEKVKVEVDEKT